MPKAPIHLKSTKICLLWSYAVKYSKYWWICWFVSGNAPKIHGNSKLFLASVGSIFFHLWPHQKTEFLGIDSDIFRFNPNFIDNNHVITQNECFKGMAYSAQVCISSYFQFKESRNNIQYLYLIQPWKKNHFLLYISKSL